MTCLFDLDCFNTRCFKPYTGKTLDCANYLSESDREGGRMLSSASKLPHLLAHFRRPFWAWSTPPAPVVFGCDSTDNSQTPLSPSYAFISSVCRSSLNQTKKSNDLPPGTFLSHLSCQNDSHTWPGKPVGLSPNQNRFRLSGDKVRQP